MSSASLRHAVGGDHVLHHHLVEGEGARLVGAEHGHAGELLDGGEPRDDGLVLGESAPAEGEGGGADHLVGDGHDGDEQHNRLDDDDLDAVAAHAEHDRDGSDARQPHRQDGKEDLQQHLVEIARVVD